MSRMHLTKTTKKTNPIYVIIEQMIDGTSEDDRIVGYFKSRKEALNHVAEANSSSMYFHYSFQEIFEL